MKVRSRDSITQIDVRVNLPAAINSFSNERVKKIATLVSYAVFFLSTSEPTDELKTQSKIVKIKVNACNVFARNAGRRWINAVFFPSDNVSPPHSPHGFGQLIILLWCPCNFNWIKARSWIRNAQCGLRANICSQLSKFPRSSNFTAEENRRIIYN